MLFVKLTEIWGKTALCASAGDQALTVKGKLGLIAARRGGGGGGGEGEVGGGHLFLRPKTTVVKARGEE